MVAAEGGRSGHFETGWDVLDIDLDSEDWRSYGSLAMDVMLRFTEFRERGVEADRMGGIEGVQEA